jgi:hypothetical protein
MTSFDYLQIDASRAAEAEGVEEAGRCRAEPKRMDEVEGRGDVVWNSATRRLLLPIFCLLI